MSAAAWQKDAERRMQAPWDILGWERGRRDPAPTGITSTASGQAVALHTPPVLTEAKERSQRQGQQQRASATATSHGAFVASCNSTEKQVLEASAPHFQRQRALCFGLALLYKYLKKNIILSTAPLTANELLESPGQ